MRNHIANEEKSVCSQGHWQRLKHNPNVYYGIKSMPHIFAKQ